MNITLRYLLFLELCITGLLAGSSTIGNPIIVANDVVWGKQISTPGNESLISVNVDSQDNIYVVGSTDGAVAGDNAGEGDVYFIKFTSDGTELFRRQIGTPNEDRGQYILCDREDNVLITGSTKGILGDRQIGERDAFLAKYTPEGELLWIVQYGTEQEDQGSSITLDEKGNIVVSGGTFGRMGKEAFGKQDGVITKLSSDGEILWNVQFGTPEFEYGRGLCINSKGIIYAVSSYYMTDISSIVAVSPEGEILQQKDFSDIRLLDVFTYADKEMYVSGHDKGISMFSKLDQNFDRLWLKTFTHGSWSGEKKIQPLTGDRYVTSGCMNWPQCYGFVRVYDKEGILQNWIKIRKSTDPESEDSTCGHHLAVDSEGVIYHVGGTDEDLYAPNAGGKDGFLCKIRL